MGLWPNSPARPLRLVMICPLARMAPPMPSETLVRADIGGEDDHGVVEREESGGTAPGASGHGAFGDPLFFDQLFDDGGDGAGLEAGGAGEVGARDGLLGTDDLEDDVAIDVARV